MVVRKDVAEKAGVSEMTVTRVVSGKGYVSEATRKRVQKCIDELNYIPNKIAANLVSRKSNVIAVILPDLTNPYYMQLVDEMIAAAQKNGQTVMLFRAKSDDIERVLDDIISNRVCGVVNMALFEIPVKYVERFKAMDVRLVHAGYPDDDFMLQMDYGAAMHSAFELLKKSGRKKVAFLAGFDEHQIGDDYRIKFFKRYCAEFGYDGNPSLVMAGTYPTDGIYIVGHTLACRLAETHPDVDAVFCLNDMMAFGAISGFISKGLRVPEDMSVIGFDNLSMSEYFEPPLTTIASDIRKEAQLYVDYVSGVISGGKYVIESTFVTRKTLRNIE